MTTAVIHINLLQRSGPRYTVGWLLLAVMTLTVVSLGWYGYDVWTRYATAAAQRDAVVAELRQAQARLADLNNQKARSADALALRAQVEALEPQAQAARALLSALKSGDSGDGPALGRCLSAIREMNDRGTWLTSVTLSAGGKQVELQGEGQSGAAVLRFARRANDAVRPLSLRLDHLEMQPVEGGGNNPAVRGTVSFRLK
jgi:hypothetical protein